MHKRKTIPLLLSLISISLFPLNGSARGYLLETPLNEEGLFGLTSGFAMVILLIIFLMLVGIVLVLMVLAKLRQQVDKSKWESENPGQPYIVKKETFLEGFRNQWNGFRERTNPTFIVLGIVGILTMAMFTDWYKRAQDLGSQQGYAPEQPIKFNHKIHAGQYQIQCQYCHTGVERGKQANIPSSNICMNCHNYIKQGPQYGTTEIAKVVEAYNTKKPIKWVRIHNLPDHVYFNHQQHVVAGKVKCQQCHGPIQEMEKVQQISTLEMGWCINCHRESKINSDNPYYAQTFDFIKKHKEMKKNGAAYTVAQMGGLECSKCHY